MAVEISNKMSLSIAVIDPNDCNPSVSESFHTRVSAITPTTKDFLKSINVWNELERKNAFVATQVEMAMRILIPNLGCYKSIFSL
jgi:2-octaprenyl-3-methyl-6-methoxy-1,4-benzoquinol hydroxylase/2-octaprenylphenol hydroxylase